MAERARRRQARPRPAGRGGRPAHDLQPRAPQRARPRDPRRARRDAAAPRPRDRGPLRADHRRAAGLLRRLRHRRRSPTRPSSATPRRSSPIPSTPRWRRSPPTPGRPSRRSTATASAAASSWRSPATCGSAPPARSSGMPPAKLGLIYGHTGLRKFLDTIGLARTKELFLTGRNFDADARRARSASSTRSSTTTRSSDAAVELAAEIAANAPLSMRGNKQRDRAAQRRTRC